MTGGSRRPHFSVAFAARRSLSVTPRLNGVTPKLAMRKIEHICLEGFYSVSSKGFRGPGYHAHICALPAPSCQHHPKFSALYLPLFVVGFMFNATFCQHATLHPSRLSSIEDDEEASDMSDRLPVGCHILDAS
jgi:hypothetical protein